jgi:hypothetical protein
VAKKRSYVRLTPESGHVQRSDFETGGIDLDQTGGVDLDQVRHGFRVGLLKLSGVQGDSRVG